ncbi:unnamed protein product [Durusdinium trenchii]|uniref:BRO1 domain-containing protein n=1 Tax=Durusdinium trenchii TaxID=1381693 RepID=A0ABP0MRM0_9DINO
MAPRSNSPFASPRPLRSPRTAEKVVKRNISLCDLADDVTREPDFLDESRERLSLQATGLLNEAEEAIDEEAFQAAERAASDALHLFREIGDRTMAVTAAVKSILVWQEEISISSLDQLSQGREELEAAYIRASEDCAEGGYSYDPLTWALDITVPDEQTKQAVELCDLNAIWPSAAGSLDREDFRQRMRGRGATSDRAIDSVFNAFTGGTYLITRRDEAQELLQACRAGGKAETGPLGPGLLSARLQIIGAAMMMSLVELKMLQAVKPKEVISMAKAALALVQPLHNKPLKAHGLVTLAQSYEHAQKGDHMMRAARAAVEAYRQLADKRGEAKALHFVAAAAGLNNDLNEAVRSSSQACALYHELQLHALEAPAGHLSVS